MRSLHVRHALAITVWYLYTEFARSPAWSLHCGCHSQPGPRLLRKHGVGCPPLSRRMCGTTLLGSFESGHP